MAMRRFLVVALLVAQLLPLGSAAKSTNKTTWLTLNGKAPKVVARGGFSGLFPDSSLFAYSVALTTSLPDVVLWCDVQLTKDAAGICFPDLTLANSSNTDFLSGAKKNTYTVNGVPTSGLFTIDYSLPQLSNVTLIQGIFSRSPNFDVSGLSILTVQTVSQQIKPPGFWLNIQHDLFFSQHKLNMQSFVLGVIKSGISVNYISSPEVGFLKGIAPKLNQTKLVFRFLQEHQTEPTTNELYSSLLKNLTFIKTFSAGILVPKSYIWPFDSSLYLLPHTSLVHDAHQAGLEVFAADFANDNVLSYNYSYDPIAEYLSFVDNGEFSVDGVLSDFPITPSEAIDCFAHLGRKASVEPPLVISHNGASGDYPGCTDLAYTKAILDGADFIDCTVQLSKDEVPFCLSTINLMDSTTIAQTGYIALQKTIPELQKGIFSFELTWNEIQGLTPAISNIDSSFFLYRNPKNKNAGKLVSLADFLRIAKNSTTSPGVTVIIENAAYLARKQNMSATEAVLKALDDAGYTNQTASKVKIQSTNSSVLEVFKGKGYQLVYELDEVISDVQNSTLKEIRSFADAVVLRKMSIYPSAQSFITKQTKVVDKFLAFNISVYAQVFRNEFVSQDWDFFSDSTVELNSFAVGAGVGGIITDYPKTAVAYRKNRCLTRKNKPSYMEAITPGALLQAMNPQVLPPAQAPAEVLTDADVSEPPLPEVAPAAAPSSTPAASSPTKTPSTSGGHRLIAALSSLATVIIASAIFWC